MYRVIGKFSPRARPRTLPPPPPPPSPPRSVLRRETKIRFSNILRSRTATHVYWISRIEYLIDYIIITREVLSCRGAQLRPHYLQLLSGNNCTVSQKRGFNEVEASKHERPKSFVDIHIAQIFLRPLYKFTIAIIIIYFYALRIHHKNCPSEISCYINPVI